MEKKIEIENKALVHILIIWSEGLVIKDEVLLDIKNSFNILNISKISWGDNFFLKI
jgi:hypothetical protein